jgi:hypothetical protein
MVPQEAPFSMSVSPVPPRNAKFRTGDERPQSDEAVVDTHSAEFFQFHRPPSFSACNALSPLRDLEWRWVKAQ